MRNFILYTVIGTLATFAVIVYYSLMPHLMKTPAFALGVTPNALFKELPSFLFTLALSWIIWWSVSGILSLILYSVGKYTGIVLFVLSFAAILGITVMIT